MQLLVVLMKRTYKLTIISAFTFVLFFVFPVSNLISVFGQALGGTSASSVNDNNNNNDGDNNNYNNNHTIAQRIGNTTNTITGGLSASSVGNGIIASDRTGNTTNTITGGLSASSLLEDANSK
jgi:hypothetical protein